MTFPLLLIHGLDETASRWKDVRSHLPADLDVLAPDLPGFGGTERGASCTLSAVSATLAASVTAQAGGPVDVVGHGWGGSIAIALAAVRPDLVRRLAVIAGGWPPWLAAGPEHGEPGLGRGEAIAGQWGGALDGRSRALRQAYLVPDPGLSGRPRPARSLVIWGAQGRRPRPRQGEKVVSALGRYVDPATVTMVTLPGIGDAPHVAVPARVASLLCEFLRAS